MTIIVTGIRPTIADGDTRIEWHIVVVAAPPAILPPVAAVLLSRRWFVTGLVDTEK